MDKGWSKGRVSREHKLSINFEDRYAGILWLGETACFICKFYLSVAAGETV